MYVLDYLIYHLRPYGIVAHAQQLPDKIYLRDILLSADSITKESQTKRNNKISTISK